MEDELFDYGTFKLRKDALIHNINNEKNLLKYINAYRLNEQDARDFRNAVAYLAEGIANGTITKDLNFKPEPGNEGQIQVIDNTGGLNNHSEWGGRAISYLGKIADAQGKHKGNKKATQVKEKEYDDISMYLAKSLYPNATGLLDPNIDWDSFNKKYSGQAHKAAYDILSGFTKSENTNPEIKAKLETILPKLIDADGITADDRLELNRAGISGQFIPFLEKQLKVVTPPPPGGGQGNNGDGNQGNGKKEDPPVVTPQIIPQPINLKYGIGELKEQGDYYIEGQDSERKQYVLWDNNILEVPMTFVNTEAFNKLRELLQKGYRNRYNEEKMEETLEALKKEINEYGMSSSNATNDINTANIQKVKNWLKQLGIKEASFWDQSAYQDQLVYNIIRNLSTLPMPKSEKQTKEIQYPGMHYVKYQQGGNIIKASNGTPLIYNPNNELYKSLYKVGAKSIGLAGANNSLRSKNLKFNTTHNEELDLNTYYKGFNLYENPEDRHKDFISWANKYYIEGDTIEGLLNRYNDSVDNMYKYKQTDAATTYKSNGNVLESIETGKFNTTYNDHYASANANIFGFDPNSIKISGSATMARHPDITDNDIEMDFSKYEITNEGLKKLLTSNKLVKYKTGHYGYATSNTGNAQQGANQETVQGKTPPVVPGDDDNSVRVKSELDKEELPEKEEQVTIPGTPSKLASNIPFIAAGLIDQYATNEKIHDLQGDMIGAYRSPINLHRPVFGNLRALAEANRRAGQRNAMARQLFTADQSFNAALMMDTFNKNMEDLQNALAIDDTTRRDSEEKARQEKKEEYLTNQEIAWGNTQTAVQQHNEDVVADMTKETANWQGRKNALDEWKTYFMADVTKKNEEKLTSAHNRLWNHIQQSPVSYIGGWTMEDQKLWNRYLAGDTITDPAEKQKLMQIQNLMNDVYLQKRFPDAGFKMPHMNNIRLLPPSYDDSVVAEVKRKGGLLKYLSKNKSGGKVTNDQVKAIIQYLKESNKNYNKAIDRSVKGLYNSIKLQKERKK